MTTTEVLSTDTGIQVQPDRTRVINRFFVPGREDVGPGDSRAGPVAERVLRMDETDVVVALGDIDDRFTHRHRDLHGAFEAHAAMIMPRLESGVELSTARRLLLGAAFSHEYAVEGAAICNPSLVLHPQQPVDGNVAFIMSVRCVGEGHISSIGFRTGFVTDDGAVTVDRPGPFTEAGTAEFVGNDGPSYRATFAADSLVSERLLWPQTAAERHGMEDARFVRFVSDSGDVTYYATYTAFDGVNITQHLLQTIDFETFHASPITGAAATGKGLAIFPRLIKGRYAALSRSDRETNAITFSDSLHRWDERITIQSPEQPWEILQLGNCGSPIETDAGWLVLTHGVGAMRTYSLGAILLDLDEPQRVLARSAEPLLSPGNSRRDGYVPNVVYSCGALAHNDILVLPYGVGDQTVHVATMSISALIESMHPEIDSL